MRKLRLPWTDVLRLSTTSAPFVRQSFRSRVGDHESGMRIAGRYGYRIYDSLMIAAALEAACFTLYSEDMQHGQVIDGLTIRNPFRVV